MESVKGLEERDIFGHDALVLENGRINTTVLFPF